MMTRFSIIPADNRLRTALQRSARIAAWWMLLSACTFAQQPSASQTGYRISGTVVNSVTGQPLPQVRVFLARPQAREDQEVVITGPDGRFLFGNVPAGKYALAAGKPGFLMQGFEEHENYSSAIVVGPGLSAEDLVFRIHPAGVIAGQIADEQNEPVRDAQVMLLRSRLQDGTRSMRRAGQTNSDDRGQYRFALLPPGTYFVVVSARPWYAAYTAFPNNPNREAKEPLEATVPLDVTYPIVYYPGATESNQATPLTLAAGDHLTADFTLTAVRSLHIRVRTPKAEANEGFRVLAMPEVFQGVNLRLPIPLQTTRSKPGEVDVSGLPPGQYRLQIVFPGRESTSYTQELDLQSDTEIDPGSTDQSQTISGTLRMQDGSRLPAGATVALRNNTSGDGVGARVSPDGQFQFNYQQVIPRANYEVAIGTQNMFLVSLSASGARVTGRTIEIRGSDAIHLSIVASQGIGRIDGTAVSGDDAKPMAGVMVLLVPHDPANNAILIRRDQSDSDGTFTLPSVVPGQYTLLAIRNGWDLEWMNPAVLKPYLQAGEPVEVRKNGKYNFKVNVQ
jgi:5-hydroxyisourate hydrolase-like protein (transthyretin family)